MRSCPGVIEEIQQRYEQGLPTMGVGTPGWYGTTIGTLE
jgi:hypothetical protein